MGRSRRFSRSCFSRSTRRSPLTCRSAMTDLPVALLSAIAVLASARAVRTARVRDVVQAALALGGAVGTKHSALVVVAVVLGLALFEVLRERAEGPTRRRRAAAAAFVLVGAWVFLWGLYGFRFRESGDAGDTFNRPLASKLDDVGSPLVRESLRAAERWRLLPRPYIWGLADVTRAAVEGRSFPFFAFGKIRSTTPAWYFPAILGVKLPLGLLVLAVGGLAWTVAGRAARLPSRDTLLALGLAGGAFLATLAVARAGYAGVRHALPVLPALAALAGAAAADLGGRDRRIRVAVAGLFTIAAASALLVPRPWEFHNLLAGGTANAWKLFNNEGIDLGQRSLELARYEREVLRPRAEVPFVAYSMAPEQSARLGLRGRAWESADGSGTLTGTFHIRRGGGTLQRVGLRAPPAGRARRPPWEPPRVPRDLPLALAEGAGALLRGAVPGARPVAERRESPRPVRRGGAPPSARLRGSARAGEPGNGARAPERGGRRLGGCPGGRARGRRNRAEQLFGTGSIGFGGRQGILRGPSGTPGWNESTKAVHHGACPGKQAMLHLCRADATDAPSSDRRSPLGSRADANRGPSPPRGPQARGPSDHAAPASPSSGASSARARPSRSPSCPSCSRRRAGRGPPSPGPSTTSSERVS